MTENLQYRLSEYNITPPGDAWPNIAAELDKDAEQKLSLKLQQAVIEPPASVWDNIANALSETSQSPVIPIGRRWTRLAVAAVTIGVIVLAGLSYLMLRGTNDESVTVIPNTPQTVQPNTNNNDNNIPQTEDKTATEPVVVYQPQRSNRPVALVAARRTVNPRIRYAHVETPDFDAGETALHVDDLVAQQVSLLPNTYIKPTNYLTVAAPNGQPAKISAKFTDGLGCIFNTDPQGLEMALKAISWKRRFSNWSNTLIANTGFIPAASNFMDILELQELLKEQ